MPGYILSCYEYYSSRQCRYKWYCDQARYSSLTPECLVVHRESLFQKRSKVKKIWLRFVFCKVFQTVQKSTGMGTGPVLGGQAGGQDYSLSSMLERAPYRTKEGQGRQSLQHPGRCGSRLTYGQDVRLVFQENFFAALRGA